MPYRTLDNVIDGVVLTFTDITNRKEADERTVMALEYAENIINTLREPLVVMDRDLTVISASRSFYRTFQVSPSDTTGKKFTEIANNQWDIPNLISLLKDVLLENSFFEDIEISHEINPYLKRQCIAIYPSLMHSMWFLPYQFY